MTTENGLINAVLLDGNSGGKLLDWSGVRSWTAEQGALWVHLDFTSEAAQNWLEAESGIEPLISEALVAEWRTWTRPGIGLGSPMKSSAAGLPNR